MKRAIYSFALFGCLAAFGIPEPAAALAALLGVAVFARKR